MKIYHLFEENGHGIDPMKLHLTVDEWLSLNQLNLF